MAKNLMKIYKTQEEYDNELCYIPSDTLSIVIENNKVNYGVNVHEGSGYFVKLDGEKIDIGMDTIPSAYNSDNTVILSVEIGCGINKIGSYAFRNCTNLLNVTILGDILTISSSAFRKCTNLSCIKYYGTTKPIHGNYVFYGNNIDYIQVTKDYEGNDFCGMAVDKVL